MEQGITLFTKRVSEKVVMCKPGLTALLICVFWVFCCFSFQDKKSCLFLGIAEGPIIGLDSLVLSNSIAVGRS